MRSDSEHEPGEGSATDINSGPLTRPRSASPPLGHTLYHKGERASAPGCDRFNQTIRLYRQSLLEASRAPSTRAPSLAQAISAWTRPPSPQSVPAITLSRPTHVGKAQDPLGDKLRMLDQIGGVADDARQQDLAVRQLDVVPQLPFVLVAHVAGLERIALRLDLRASGR